MNEQIKSHVLQEKHTFLQLQFFYEILISSKIYCKKNTKQNTK